MEETTKHTASPIPTVAAPAGDAKVHHEHAEHAEHAAAGTSAHAHAYAHAEEHEPHMPPPSLSPIILGAGMTLLVFGLVFGPIVLALGVIGTLIGLGTWLYDEIKNANTPPGHE